MPPEIWAPLIAAAGLLLGYVLRPLGEFLGRTLNRRLERAERRDKLQLDALTTLQTELEVLMLGGRRYPPNRVNEAEARVESLTFTVSDSRLRELLELLDVIGVRLGRAFVWHARRRALAQPQHLRLAADTHVQAVMVGPDSTCRGAFLPVANTFAGGHFTVVQQGRRYATPLLLALVAVEVTDLSFAVDSIPAIFAITQDPFIVYTSNVFAILGLRALYFLLAGVIHKFHYLKVGLALILVFVGTKMLLVDVYPIPIGVSLVVIALVLTLSVVASLMWPKAAEAHDPVVHDPFAPPPPDPVHSPPLEKDL